MTKSDQIRAKIEQLKIQARLLLDKDGVTAEELTEINAKITLEQQKLETEERLVQDINAKRGKKVETQLPGEENEDERYETAVFNALRNKATTEDAGILSARNSLSSDTAEDGGYLIPVDQQTKINELKRSYQSLRDHVTVEPVNTKTGSRVLEKDSEHTAFGEITEEGTISTVENPKFTTVIYKIADRGGILPVPNNLLNDTNTTLKAYLNRWLAKKAVATENAIILTKLNTFEKTAVTGIDDIKNILDVSLDPAISAQAEIIVNQDSFSYLNKLKDSEGNYILERDPKNPTRKILSGRPVVVFSNKVLKSTGNKAPLIIGSLKEAITLFDRQAISLLSTNIGGDAFKNNRTDIRAIMRLDAQKTDTSAIIFGEITLS